MMRLHPVARPLRAHVQQQAGWRFLACDECGAVVEMSGQTAILASRAHVAGWRVYAPHDWVVCPDCTAHYIAGLVAETDA